MNKTPQANIETPIVVTDQVPGPSNALHQVSTVTIDRNFPVKLQNKRVNVCFFNSICQVLYSMPLFRTYLEQMNLDQVRNDSRIERLQKLFTKMKDCDATRSVYTFDTVKKLKFRHYTPGQQYDAQEALSQILSICFPNNDNEHNMFRICSEVTLQCNVDRIGCGNNQKENTYAQILILQVQEFAQQTVNTIFDGHLLSEMPEGYKCELGTDGGCQKLNTCSISTTYQFADVLIIQLAIFDGVGRKVFPELV